MDNNVSDYSIHKKLEEITGQLKSLNEQVCKLQTDQNVFFREQRKRNARQSMQLQLLKKSKKLAKSYPLPRALSTSVSEISSLSLKDGDFSENDDIHGECIRELIETFVKDVRLEGTTIVDNLVEDNCLTEDEANNLLKTDDRKDQNRKLALLMSRRSKTSFSNFLEILSRKENYPEIANQLKELFSRKEMEGRKSSECLVCVIKRDVNIRDVIDKLYKHGIIDIDFMDDVLSNHHTSGDEAKCFWDVILSTIENSPQLKANVQFLQEALGPKYDHISARLGNKRQLSCTCDYYEETNVIVQRLNSVSSGSTDEGSNTSVNLRRNIEMTDSSDTDDRVDEWVQSNPNPILVSTQEE